MIDSAHLERLRALIDSSTRIVGFTGAGISTESGIPDYRSQGGIWNRFQPVYFQEFLSDPAQRQLYWERKAEMWPAISSAGPGPGHTFFLDLQNRSKLLGLITQNIDGLHERSGISPERMVNLHGTSLEIVCLSCGTITPTAEFFPAYNPAQDPRCETCGGLLKPNTISFGQGLDLRTIERSRELSASCDLMIVMGSTLVVQPAAGLPVLASQAGAALAIVTLSETPLDDLADVVINAPIGEVVSLLGFS